jgi:hypothetical protein
VTVTAKKGDVEGFVVIPVMAFQPTSSSAPRTATGSFDQTQLLGQGGGIPRRASPDPPGPHQVGGDFEMASQTGELGVLTVPANLFHDTDPKL